MSVRRCSRQLLRLHKRSFSCTTAASSEASLSEYVEKPSYPEQLPTYKCPSDKTFLEWIAKIDRLPTIEQKLIEMNMPKYYGFSSILISDNYIPLNGNAFIKYATRTQVVKGLPEHYHDELHQDVTDVLPAVRDRIEEVILLQFGEKLFRENLDEDRKKIKGHQSFFIQNLNYILMQELCGRNPSLDSSVVDVNPRLENFWLVGGFEPNSFIKKSREKNPKLEGHTLNKYFRGTTRPQLALRTEKALPEVVPLDDPLSTTGEEIPTATLKPDAYGYWSSNRPAVITPGFWPGEQNEHCLLFLHTRDRFAKFTDTHGTDYKSLGLENWATGVCFTQASAFGFYHDMSLATDVKAPYVQQSVFTDGRDFAFCVYQMNTSLIHSEHASSNPRNNILWMSEDMRLFDTVEGSKVRGLNDDVLRILISMYLKQCQEVFPLPTHGYKYLKDHDAPEALREEFQKRLLHILSQRPRWREKPEIFSWEEIYKIKFKTRPFEPKRRFFELPWREKAPFQRRLDEHSPVYIPKQLRIDPSVKKEPTLHSERLFNFGPKVLYKRPFYPDDVIFRTLNRKRPDVKFDLDWKEREQKSFFWDK